MSIYNETTIKRRVSSKQKESNNFKRQRDIMDTIDFGWYGRYRDTDRIKKFKINYDLINGRLDPTFYDEDDTINFFNENVNLKDYVIDHYPLISQVANSIIGEGIMRPFKLGVDDLSPLNHTFKSNEYKKLIDQYITLNVIKPVEARAKQEVLKSLGISDESQVPKEQAEQFSQQVEQKAKALTPKEIVDYINNEFVSPTVKQAKEVLDYLEKHLEIKEKTDEGWKHAIATGEEFYYVDVVGTKIIFEMVPPSQITWGGSDEEEWIQHKTWVKRERMLDLHTATNRYAELLGSVDLKKLESFVEPLYSNMTPNEMDNSAMTKTYMIDIANNYQGYLEEYENLDVRTLEGQSNIRHIKDTIAAKYGGEYSLSQFGVREVHITWMDQRKFYRVTRLNEIGEKIRFWADEDYGFTPQDIKIEELWLDEVWEGRKLGWGSDAVYFDIKPLRYQYKSNKDPFEVTHPYIGKCYNTMRGETRNVSLVDLGKPFQKEFDIQMAALKHDLKTNMGKLFMMFQGLKPDNLSFSQWISLMKNFSMVLADPKKAGLSNMDPQLLKSIDASKMSDMANRIQLMEFAKQNLFRSMYYNEARAGAAGQYATTGNVESQAQASYNQTEALFETHRQIVEKSVQSLLNKARLFYKDNIDQIEDFISPSSLIELKTGTPFWYSYFGIKVMNSGAELRQVEEIKRYFLSILQNTENPEDILMLTQAESKSEVAAIIRNYQKKIDEYRQQAQQAQQQAIQEEGAMKERLIKQEKEYERIINQDRDKARIQMAELNSMTMQNANDVDRDGRNDLLVHKQMDVKARQKEHEDKMAIKRLELELQRLKIEKMSNSNNRNR